MIMTFVLEMKHKCVLAALTETWVPVLGKYDAGIQVFCGIWQNGTKQKMRKFDAVYYLEDSLTLEHCFVQ